ncbi:hypothetical protein EMIHUDRAFT_455644 [Emiliania huxleyi CCMP1516]|uniref:Major facilitator superfamily (MFS) profile domain-containing protein n=2 Tax=Emiliania huxleyi TaxID=2903 RepID=A0A0D3KDT2_EMIH1|nr:hypothetical protein EMIHUDRAFT_455644 [Emiliania huxleyi CCMP1516]EOD33917.1 hypothetical protein EMIHUDRAFT_455644 [Emiliania huxleyi CCMP1516]|eukprot:XP_005786346.1 hypothetical protein EMIHUDRAFT_455644 [Emiliania huxleyi CCMP1516]
MADSAQSFIFIGLATLNIVISLDGGGVPAALTNIQLRFGLQAWQLGLLGSLVYVGQATGCLLGGPLLKRFSPTRVCRVMVCLNTAMTAMFASSQNSAWLLSTRFFIGLLQAPTSVYFPVWVDEYAPPERRTRWMALIQGGTPLGIMLGYAISGVMTLDKELGDGCHAGYIEHAGSCLSTEGWRVPFYVQSAVLVCFTIAGFFLPQKSFDLPDTVDAGLRQAQRQSRFSQQPPPSLREDASHAAEAYDETPPMIKPPQVARKPTNLDIALEKISSRITSHSVLGRERLDSGMLVVEAAREVFSLSRRASAPVMAATGSIAATSPVETPVGSPSKGSSGGLTTSGPATGWTRLAQASTRSGCLSSLSGGSGGSDGSEKSAGAVGVADAGGQAGGDAPNDEEEGIGVAADAPLSHKPTSVRRAVRHLLSSRVFVSTVFANCALFFVVTGIQFWVTPYLTDYLGAKKLTVVFIFAITSITAPIIGLAVGGTVNDRLGGYQGKRGVARTLKVDACFGCLAAIAAISAAAVPSGKAKVLGYESFPLGFDANCWAVVALLWITLFFGGCIVPSTSGVLMETAPPDARPVASALGMFSYQLFGYALSPQVSSLVMQIVGSSSEEEAEQGVLSPTQLRVGFYTVMSWGSIGFVFLTIASCFAARNLRREIAAAREDPVVSIEASQRASLVSEQASL